MLVDHHAHWLPEPVLERLARRAAPPRAWREGDRWVFQAAMLPRPLDRSAHDLDHRARQLAGLGIDRQVLSWSPLWNLDALPDDEAHAVARSFNDETAAHATARVYRGLAVVPVGDVAAALDELRRARAIGLEGFVLPASTLCDATHADAMTPWFDAARDLGMRIFVHPGRLPPAAGTDDPSPRTRLARHLGLEPQHEIGLAMLTLCEEGWLAAFPDVEVQFANGGGSFLPLLERLQRMAEHDLPASRRRSALLARCIVDTASLGRVGIRAARSLLGAPRVVLGTDEPIFAAARAVEDWHLAALEPNRSTAESVASPDPEAAR